MKSRKGIPNIAQTLTPSLFYERSLRAQISYQKAIAKRIDRLRKIVIMRKQNKMTLEKIGKEFGITRERVRQLIKKFNLE